MTIVSREFSKHISENLIYNVSGTTSKLSSLPHCTNKQTKTRNETTKQTQNKKVKKNKN